MTTTIAPLTLDDRIVEATIGTLEMFSIHLGRRLGLYDALSEPRNVAEFASGAGIDRRYAREWLEQQATAGFITVEDPAPAWDRRRYRLSDSQRALLVTEDDLSHVSPLADMVVGVAQVLGRVADAYRTGGGVPYAAYGATFRDGQAAVNRPAYTHELTGSWLAAVPDIVSGLSTGGGVADLGCGAGWSTIALAKAFPHARIVGIDSDPASIDDARSNAAKAGVNVRFECADASSLIEHGPFDLVLILEALHDMAQPTEVLSHVRKSLSDDGALLVADEKVADRFDAPGDELERFMYGWSVLHCLPAALAETPSAAIGTVIRPDHVRTLAADAGFGAVELSDIDAGFFHLYVARA